MAYALCESSSSDASEQPHTGKCLVSVGAILRNNSKSPGALPNTKNRIIVLPDFSHYTRNIMDYVGEENYILVEEDGMTDERADELISNCANLIADGNRLITKEMIGGGAD